MAFFKSSIFCPIYRQVSAFGDLLMHEGVNLLGVLISTRFSLAVMYKN